MSKYRVVISSKKILVHKWWGQNWCKNIANYADFSNRLERGRSYIRNGRVHDIAIEHDDMTIISAKVNSSCSSALQYNVKIFIQHLPKENIEEILKEIVTLNVFKEGIVPENYKFLFSIEKGGLFPKKEEIKFECDCPDVAVLCKHIIAVLYAIGCILDQEPLLLFQLRGIDVESYLDTEIRKKTNELLVCAKNFNAEDRLIEDDLVAEIFGIDIGEFDFNSFKPTTLTVESINKEEIRTIVIESDPEIKKVKPVKKERTVSAVKKKTTKEKNTNAINHNHVVVRQYGLDGIFIAQYESYDDAAQQTGIAKRIIQRNIWGERKSGGGYIWKKEVVNNSNE